MEKEFIPYEQALALKELGFDEPCLYAWCNKGGWNKYEMIKEPIVQILKNDGNPFGQFFNGKNWNKEIIPNTKNSIQCSAPLYQQSFRWFRKKYGYYVKIDYVGYVINSIKEQPIIELTKSTYEQAELECLKKLIEIVKQKQVQPKEYLIFIYKLKINK